MRSHTLKKIAGALLVAGALTSGCSTPSAPEFKDQPAYQNDVSTGWGLFTQGNYTLAAVSFRNALTRDVNQSWAQAYEGLGWTLAMQDSLQKAVLNFNLALARPEKAAKDSVYIMTGLCFAQRDISPPNYQKVRDAALAVLEIDPNFVFEYRTSINANDLKAVLAEAYFNLGQYEEAAALADPDGALDPEAVDYNEQLLALINQMLTDSREGV